MNFSLPNSVPRLKDVADAAGVHTSTVSRALNPATAGLLKPEVAQRVRDAAASMGYTVNTLAAGLRTRQSRTIGIVVRDMTNTMMPLMFRGIEDRLREEGYTALLGNTYAEPERRRDLIAAFLGRRVDGIIMTYADIGDEAAAAIRRQRLPLVLLNRSSGDPDEARVLPDITSGIDAVVDHLIGLGHRAIAHIAGPGDAYLGRMKAQAFAAAVARHGIAPRAEWTVRALKVSEQAAVEATRALLSCSARPTAIVAANDILALGCLTELSAQGIRCPDEISVTGFNDMPFVDRIGPGLTTVHIPHFEMGRQAACLLLELIKLRPLVESKLVLPTKLVVRGTTGPSVSKDLDNLPVRGALAQR